MSTRFHGAPLPTFFVLLVCRPYCATFCLRVDIFYIFDRISVVSKQSFFGRETMSKFFVREVGYVTLVIDFGSSAIYEEFEKWTSENHFSQIFKDTGGKVIRTFHHTDIGLIESWLEEHGVKKTDKPANSVV